MSWQTARRSAFHPGGPFLFKRNGNVGNIEVAFGDVVTAERLADEAGLSVRQIDALYNGYWMDMAPPEDTDNGGESPDGLDVNAADEPQSPADAPQEGEEPSEAPTAPDEAVEAPEGAVAVACRALGFGYYKRETAEGLTFGERMNKVEAEQTALPLLPQLPKA